MFRLFLVLASLFVAGSVAAQIAVVEDGSGNRIGAYLGPGKFDNSAAMLVLLPSGYTVSLDAGTGQISALAGCCGADGGYMSFPLPYFMSSDCTGQMYFPIGGSENTKVAGFVFRGAHGQLYAVAPGAVPTNVSLQSRFGTSCSSLTPGLYQALPGSANDPQLTGFPASGFQPPLRLKYVSMNVFRDGFEVAA